MKFVSFLLYASILACGEALYHSEAIDEQSSKQVKLSSNSEQVELSECFLREERRQSISTNHYQNQEIDLVSNDLSGFPRSGRTYKWERN